MELQNLVKQKMIERLKRELKMLEKSSVQLDNDERHCDIQLHRQLLNFLYKL